MSVPSASPSTLPSTDPGNKPDNTADNKSGGANVPPTPNTPPSVTPDPTAAPPSSSIDNTMLIVPAPPGSPDAVSGILVKPEAVLNDPRVQGMVDGLSAAASMRMPSRDLFKSENAQPLDDALLKQLVTPQRVRDLWNQIDALQEEVIQGVQADRSTTDTYQQDLLYASTLLLESAAHYDEAREVVYRIRGDLNRERKIMNDVHHYRPMLLLYYGVWFVIVILLSRLDSQFRAMVPDAFPILKLAYPPILFAIFGALFNGIMAINRHTTIQRDFDPMYISWYVINPFIGGLLGLVVFVFFVVTGTSFTPNLISDPNVATTPTPVIWLLAFIVGWQQNTAVALLNGFLKTVSPGNKDDSAATSDRPTTPDSSTRQPPTS